jgi:DNA polymerase-3 subunit alpha
MAGPPRRYHGPSVTTLAPNDFTHLHVHSEFSLLDGLGRISEMVGEASALGFDSLAITDHGALYGAVAFYQACVDKQIKPIIGVETYVARRSMTDREGSKDSQPYHLILLAKDWTGYRNLCRIVTDAHLDGYYYKPRIDRDYLAKHSEGLVGLSACLNGEISRALEVEDWQNARTIAGSYADIFGPGNFFLEMQDHGLADQRRLNEQLLRLAPEVGLPLVATNDLHYVRKSQHEAHDVLLCIGTASNVSDTNRLKFETEEFYLKSAAEMGRLFRDIPEALTNTRRVAEMTDLKFEFGTLRLPDFPVPAGHTVESWLREECQRGLAWRHGTVTEELQRRLDYELGVILTMGYAGYFLIVADFVRFAREQGIATTCRGSAPGSIVTYTLGITPVDPILYELPFERFLNPDRVTMPDIDVDFEDSRRDEVIAYVTRKYGSDHVAQIITFGTMLARAAIRDVGRTLGMGYGEVDRIAKAIPNQLGIKLEEALEIAPPLREMVENDAQVAKLIDLARQVEGVARNASTHAAGVVISREPLTELMPLQRATNSDGLMTQYEMHAVEALGLLKFDFLGLSNLTILRQAVDLIREHRGVSIDLDDLPLEDTKTFDLLSSGETTGVFQLESPGMRRYVRELRPTSVLDLAAMVALFRPGPMDNIPAYIRRKHGQEAVTYLHPLLEPYLEKTYGIFVYQEDIMSAAKALGGFTGPEADTLGYAIRKKKASLMREQKAKFLSQAAERGVDAHVIDQVFKAFEPFERYGFNKAHATCYGLIAYQTAYLKANYTVDYMTSVLTAFRDNTEKVAIAIAECRRLGIEVRPPDIHKSGLHFTVEDDAIRFGLLAVKNVGEGAIQSIIDARTSDGDFKSMRDFCGRVDLRLVNTRVIEALTWAGALSRFGHPAQIIDAIPTIVPAAQADAQQRATGQISAFDMLFSGADADETLPARTEASARERMRWEKELLGLYLSGHPMGELATEMGKFVNAYSADFGEEMDQQRVVIGGIVAGVRRVITKARATMAVATLEDLQGSIDVVVFPKVFEETGPTWATEQVLLVSGRVDHKGDETVLLAESVWTWEQAQSLGVEAFGKAVSDSERSRSRGRSGGQYGNNRNGNGYGNGNGPASGGNGSGAASYANRGPVAVPMGSSPAIGVVPIGGTSGPSSGAAASGSGAGAPIVRVVARVSPLRGVVLQGDISVTIGGPTQRQQQRPPGAAPAAAAPAAAARPYPQVNAPTPSGPATDPESDEPPWPAEAAASLQRDARAATLPIEASPGQSLHVRFHGADPQLVVAGFEALRTLLKSRPGDTPVVLHIPAGQGRQQQMHLRTGVAYDADLATSIRRTLGGDVVDLSLS